MSLGTRRFGQMAESEAERYLRRKGYRILARNARSYYGEIDLIAQLAGILVFVEVKARRTSAHGGAPYAVDARKQAKLIKLAAHYLSTHQMTNRACRFDVLLCTAMTHAAPEIAHIENAFEVPGDQLQW